MDMKGRHLIIALFCFFLFNIARPSYSKTDTLITGQQLGVGDHLVSYIEICKLGFFNTGGPSQNRYYLGIWYNQAKEKANWVANPDTPIFDNSATLMLDTDGWLKISHNGSNTSTITLNSVRAAGKASATLRDNCNFELHAMDSDGSTKQVLWQSFDHPTNTLLPGMKLGFDLKSGQKWSLRSWVTDDLPGIGSFTLGMNPNDSSNQLIIRSRENVLWTSGQWHDENFANIDYSLSDLYNFSFFRNETLKYFSYTVNKDVTVFSRLTITSWGELRAYKATYLYPNDRIPFRAYMGTYPYPYGFFSIKERERIFASCYYTSSDVGCVNQKLPECMNSTRYGMSSFDFNPRDWVIPGDGFKLGNSSENLTLMDCAVECVNNCSCFAYASFNDNGTGCEFWSSLPEFGDYSYYSDYNSTLIYYTVRVATPQGPYVYWWKGLLKAVGGALAILLLCTICYFIRRKRREIQRKYREILQLLRSIHDSFWQKLRVAAENKVNQMLSYELGHDNEEDEKDGNTREWKLFSFSSIVTATNNFSSANKLGEGGFGPVYKGKLVEGQEVAIKRLSTSSRQGVVEFKNEITLIAKLQHTNLVRLLGCCIRGEEKILIYEYMPNKSLDSFLFDPSKKNLLNWGKRLCIIEGIAQGLIYLHKYSRLKIIHRDLKASNILLDNEMNPKISDFGLARIFDMHESEANTNRVVGTYGYMSPEYAMQGIVSMKIDVFSFGVLLLEIMSGRKNNSFYHYEQPVNLVGYAWELWKEDRAMELVDPTLIETCPRNEGLRCVHVGLLCVQDHAEDRPSMTDVVAMLSNETMQLCAPKKPAFFIKVDGHMTQIVEKKCEVFSLCQVSISEMQAR